MGLLTEGINEIIATTRQNAAPIGIINRGGSLKIVLFKGSHTVENVLSDGIFVANFVYDPVIFVMTAFEDLDKQYFVEEIFEDITIFRLEAAEAWILFKAELLQETKESFIFELIPLKEEVVQLNLHPVNRGFNSIIEATVHATRYVAHQDPNLFKLINHNFSIIKKCGGKRELEAIKLLINCINRIVRKK
ncbi:MAG: DUF447 family protein [Methanomicrobiaceae archaeon]|nr:DUF447 family protein [Methanomicrobiaceae archaeon]